MINNPVCHGVSDALKKQLANLEVEMDKCLKELGYDS